MIVTTKTGEWQIDDALYRALVKLRFSVIGPQTKIVDVHVAVHNTYEKLYGTNDPVYAMLNPAFGGTAPVDRMFPYK
jgi:hypothetical protein